MTPPEELASVLLGLLIRRRDRGDVVEQLIAMKALVTLPLERAVAFDDELDGTALLQLVSTVLAWVRGPIGQHRRAVVAAIADNLAAVYEESLEAVDVWSERAIAEIERRLADCVCARASTS